LLLPHGESLPLVGVKRVLGFLPSWIEAFSARSATIRGLLSDEFSARFAQREPYHALLSGLDVRGQLIGRPAVHQSLYLWSKTMLPGYILTMLGDRMEMAHSVEGRVPFMDHHVAEYLQRVPVSLKIRGMTEKYILREAVKDVITPTVYARQKHPFLSPPATMNPDQPLNALMQDTLRGSAGANVPFLDQKKVVAALDGLATPGADAGHRVVMDQVLTLALSYAFMHEGLRMSA
jgi:asparagine synthase (glutamine-hydrolysing)